MSWERKQLEDVADFTLGKMLDQKKNKGEPLPYLANINVRWGSFDLDDLRQMRFEHHEAERFGLKVGDIVMCEGGEPGRCAIWKDYQPRMMIQKALHRIRPHDGLDNRFLFYTFLHKGKTGGFSPLFTGATIKHLPKEKLAKLEVDIPPLPTQQRIATILTAYDDLIENNRRRIHLLEQAARLLYKEWFVHLRFPGHEHVKIKDGVPEGWEKKSFSDIATFLNGFAFKPSHLGELGLPIVKIPELRDGPTAKTPRNTGDRVPEKYLLESGDILFSWSGTLLVNTWNHGKALLNQHLFKVTPGAPKLRSLVYLSLNSALAEFQSQTVGSTMKHIRKDALEKVLVFVPSKVLLDEFESVAAPVLEQVSILQKQNSGLAKVRDLLLQRLMNGNLVI